MPVQLAFQNVEFSGHTSMDPPVFSPDVKEYTIHKAAGADLLFKITLNHPPKPKVEYYDVEYEGYSLEFHESGAEYKSFWSVGSWNRANCPPGECNVSISALLTKRYRDSDELHSVGVYLKVITEEMSPEQRAACTHPHTRTEEGQCFGGGSGSCSVEIIRSCTVCGATLDTSWDHRS
jgi:hypothetical protein